MAIMHHLLVAGDTAEGLGWLREYWQSRGLEPSGSIL